MDRRLNARKKVIKNQQYEDYWKITLALTDFYGAQFRRTLKMVIDHIDQYDLDIEVMDEDQRRENFKKNGRYKELQAKIRSVYLNDDKTGASTRKQINSYIKLGFIKPFLNGYAPLAKEYIKANKSKEELNEYFSDIVYKYASFNSSVTNDETEYNQVEFVVQTLLHRESKMLTIDEIIGLAVLDNPSKKYADEKEILNNTNWAKVIDFVSRKYNQKGYIRKIFSELKFFTTKGKNEDFILYLTKDAKEFLPENPDRQRDSYLFSLMKNRVYKESEKIYGDKVDWLTKKKQMGLVVSHIIPSAESLAQYDIETAYDPNNAILLSPGNNDQYFDKHYITFDTSGNVLFGKGVSQEFIDDISENNYKLDSDILNETRAKYLVEHNRAFRKKNN